jgi:hypothetical protein
MSDWHARDQRRLLLSVILTTALLFVSFFIAGYRYTHTQWRLLQQQFQSQTHVDDRYLGVRQINACGGQTDRCTTCHLGMGNTPASLDTQPFRPHSAAISGHDPERIGCGSCHGGNSAALTRDGAHALAQTGDIDPLMTAPHIQAGCARCHLPGEQPGQDRLLSGARLYAGLGCPVCHPLSADGVGGWDFGPDLRTIGRASVKYLETSLRDPTANFPGSTMPSFELALGKEPAALTDVIIFLESLSLERRPDCRNRDRYQSLVTAPCSTCHAGENGRANGLLTHRCPYLIENRETLRCGRCHDAVPHSETSRCPLITQHRAACEVCHETGGLR